jgi:hypothetical protein
MAAGGPFTYGGIKVVSGETLPDDVFVFVNQSAWVKGDELPGSPHFSFSFQPGLDGDGETVMVGYDPASGESAVYDKEGSRIDGKKQVRDGYCPRCSSVLLDDDKGRRACPQPACGYESGFERFRDATKAAREAMERLRDKLYETACEFCTPRKLPEPERRTVTSVNDSRYIGPVVATPLDGGRPMRRTVFEHEEHCPCWQLGSALMSLKARRVELDP